MDFIKYDASINVQISSRELFNSSKKYSSITLKDGTMYVKGAKEVIIDKCNYYLNSSNKVVAFNNKNIIEKRIINMTQNGGRVLLLAMGRNINNLILIGIINIRSKTWY